MKLNPLSWFSDWADRLGVPVIVVWAVVIGVCYFALSWIGIFSQLPEIIESLK